MLLSSVGKISSAVKRGVKIIHVAQEYFYDMEELEVHSAAW